MCNENKSVSIALDPETEGLVKAAAALSGMTVGEFCLAAITEKAEKKVFPNGRTPTFTPEILKMLAESRERIFNGRTLPGDSADSIREAREARVAQLRNAAGWQNLFAECDEITQGRICATDSADIIRESREERHRDNQAG